MRPRSTLLVATYGIGRMPPTDAAHYGDLLDLLRARFEVGVMEVKNNIGVFSNPRSGRRKGGAALKR